MPPLYIFYPCLFLLMTVVGLAFAAGFRRHKALQTILHTLQSADPEYYRHVHAGSPQAVLATVPYLSLSPDHLTELVNSERFDEVPSLRDAKIEYRASLAAERKSWKLVATCYAVCAVYAWVVWR